jgi:hypothetical protein
MVPIHTETFISHYYFTTHFNTLKYVLPLFAQRTIHVPTNLEKLLMH